VFNACSLQVLCAGGSSTVCRTVPHGREPSRPEAKGGEIIPAPTPHPRNFQTSLRARTHNISWAGKGLQPPSYPFPKPNEYSPR
jgi:hypothetical protein